MSSNLAVWPENTTLVRHLDVMVEDAARRFGRGSELCLRGEHTGCMNAKAWVHCSTGFFEPRSPPSAAGLVYKYSTNFAAAHTNIPRILLCSDADAASRDNKGDAVYPHGPMLNLRCCHSRKEMNDVCR